MANQIYLKARQSFMTAGINLSSDNIKASLVSASAYTPNTATNQFYTDMPSTVADSGNLSSKTVNSPNPGTFDAADETWTAVSGAQVDFVVLWKDTGTGSSSNLIVIFDTGTNLPITPNGGDITAQWSSGTDRIFTLFEGLSERDRLQAWEWLKGLFRWPKGMGAELAPSGLYLPRIKLVHGPDIVIPQRRRRSFVPLWTPAGATA